MTNTPYAEILYNQVRQKSSHNSFQRDEGSYDQFLYWRLRSLEFDIHNGKGRAPNLQGDWYIYHTAVIDEGTSVDKLSNLMTILQGLGRAVPEHEITTIFLDLKDNFDASHTPEDLDDLLVSALGRERLFTPSDLGGSNDLQAEVRANGWPRLETLRGKFAFVLTGGDVKSSSSKLNQYVDGGQTAGQRVAFIAPKISATSEITSKDYVVYFNLEMKNASAVAPRIFADGFISRVYTADNESDWNQAVAAKVHLIATNKVNSLVDPWSRTDNDRGWPFQGIEITTSADLAEPGLVYGVEAASGDLWDREDSFFFYNTNAGAADRSWSLFISSPDSDVEDWAKGSLMARESLADDAAYLAVIRAGQDHGLRLQYRPAAGAETQAIDKPVAAPDTLANDTLGFAKLVVSNGGRRAEGWGSTDGEEWVFLGGYSFADPLVYQGYGTSSHDESELVKFLFYPLTQPATPEAKSSIGDDVERGEAFAGIYF